MVPPFYLLKEASGLTTYEKEILKVLAEAGEQGLPLHKIAKHVHNSCNSLFEASDYTQVYNKVRAYIRRNVKNKNSLVEMYRRGVYRLNPSSSATAQLKIDFDALDTPAE